MGVLTNTTCLNLSVTSCLPRYTYNSISACLPREVNSIYLYIWSGGQKGDNRWTERRQHNKISNSLHYCFLINTWESVLKESKYWQNETDLLRHGFTFSFFNRTTVTLCSDCLKMSSYLTSENYFEMEKYIFVLIVCIEVKTIQTYKSLNETYSESEYRFDIYSFSNLHIMSKENRTFAWVEMEM